MQSLPDLLFTPNGPAVLHSYGIFTDSADFLSNLGPPMVETGLGRLPVYLHQQPTPDIFLGVQAKFDMLATLTKESGQSVTPWVVGIDTDRAASSRVATRLALVNWQGGSHSYKLAPPGSKYQEFRHIRTDPVQLALQGRRLAVHVARSRRPSHMARLNQILTLIDRGQSVSYSHYASDLGRFLVYNAMEFAPQYVFSSELQGYSQPMKSLSQILLGIDGFVSAFNEQIVNLHARGIQSAVAPLPHDYLPLFYSCPLSGERMRLRRCKDGRNIMAAATSQAGQTYQFSLGRGADLDALQASSRWSFDVTLPVYLSGLFSGLVAGRSSGLYCIVIRGAVRQAFGQSLCPILVPPALAAWRDGEEGLFQRWLYGGDDE